MQMSIPTQTTHQFAETPTAQNAPETYQYDVEIPSLMSTIVNAVYSSKDYAIRELVSNASDALDKYNQMYHIFQSEQATTVKDNKKDKNYDELNNNEINNNNKDNNENNNKEINNNIKENNNDNNNKDNNIKENNIEENNNNNNKENNKYKDNLVRCRLTAPSDLRIKIEVSGNTIIFSDNGIGMTKPDLVNFLGKIAASGTKAFKEQIASKNFKSESELGALIGQFGLGFYSAFLIADSVRVVTRHPRDRCYAWESRGLGDFTVQECEDEMEHGTRVILSVKEGDEKYKSESLLEELVKKYSMFMPYPLYILKEEEVDDIENNEGINNEGINNDFENKNNTEGINNDINKEENNNDIENKDENKDENNNDINKGDNNEINKDIINIEENKEENKEDVPEIKEIKEVKKKKIMKPTLINKNKPVWLKRPADCTKEEYSAFYKDISNDWEDFSFMKHVTLDGLISLTLLLFVPKRSRLNMFEKQKKDNIKLYVKNVFVTDDLKDAQPDWMTFVSGVISSDDVPMNLSRETIQGSNTMKMIKNNLPRKVLDMVEDISEDREKYEAFLKEFGSNLKMGVRDNTGQMQERIARLLRYYSSKSEDKLTSLDEYIENIEKNNGNIEKNIDINNNNNNNSNEKNNNDSNEKNNNEKNNSNEKNNNSESKQKVIYILTGLSKDEVVNSPFLDLYKDKEVLFMYEPVDEIMLQGLRSYKGYDIKRITSEGASELGKVDEPTKECFKDFISAYKDLLSKEVERIDLRNLGSAPCVISSQAYSHSAAMENIIRSQPGQENNPFLAMMGRSKKIFEINPNNSMVRNIKTCWENKDAEWKSMATLFYNTAVVECGFKMDDGVSYAKNVFSILGECLKMRCVKGSCEVVAEEENVVEICNEEVL